MGPPGEHCPSAESFSEVSAMPASELPAALERVIDEYQVHLVTNPDCRLDHFFASRRTELRLGDHTSSLGSQGILAVCQRRTQTHPDHNRFLFSDYWSRSWFEEHVDDVITVLLEDYFEVVRLLGDGGQGRVYLIKNLKVSGRLEAMKVFYVKNYHKVDAEEFKQWKARFHRESAASEKLGRFEHVPMVYEVNDRHGINYFTMQFIDGETLRDVLERTKGPIPSQKAARWMLTVAKTLIELDAGGLIHRDIKPSNLMVDQHDQLYLVDFGLVKMTSERHIEITRAGGVGTLNYMSDEQKSDAKNVTPKADIYSLGATFYHLLTGKVWERTDDQSAWPKAVAPILRDLCMACLDRDASKRPTADEVRRRLDRWLNGITRRQILAVGGGAVAGASIATWFSLVPKSFGQIQEEARLLRDDYIKDLFEERCGPKGIILFDEVGKSSHPEVRTIGQSLYALLSIPNLFDNSQITAERLDNLFVNLSKPFYDEDRQLLLGDPDRQGEPYFALHRDANDRALGWTSNNSPIPTAESVIWLAAGCAIAKQWWLTNPTFVARRQQPPFASYHRQLLEILAAYRHPSRPGQWSRYANQSDIGQYSIHTTGIALLAQLEGLRAELPLCAPPGADAADEAIRATIGFLLETRLPETGWTCRPDRQPDPADAELNLMLYTILLIAKSRGFDSLPADSRSMKDHCLSLLRRNDFHSDSKYGKQKTVSIPAILDPKSFKRGVDPDALAATFSIKFLWYPCALHWPAKCSNLSTSCA